MSGRQRLAALHTGGNEGQSSARRSARPNRENEERDSRADRDRGSSDRSRGSCRSPVPQTFTGSRRSDALSRVPFLSLENTHTWPWATEIRVRSRVVIFFGWDKVRQTQAGLATTSEARTA